MTQAQKWINITLVNLAIVAGLGLLLRAKILFSIPFIDFKNILHAHSHYAFSGWVTLALLVLMTYQLLPPKDYRKQVYQWLLTGLLVTSAGMLISFPLQGYGFFSILCSTLFIMVSYGFVFIFLRDFLKTDHSRSVKLLTVTALICLVLSSAGPFTLAYILATGQRDVVLYKNAIYTYLHLQYSGFFTLAIFALALHKLQVQDRTTHLFAQFLTYSVIPSMFGSYLWSGYSIPVYIIALAGSLLLLLCLVFFFIMIKQQQQSISRVNPAARQLAFVSMAAFVLKTLLQVFTVIPAVGNLVFTNRPVIIGFLHLVLLGFVSIYLLAHFVQSGLLVRQKLTISAAWLFVAGVLLNEIILFSQGLGLMFLHSSHIAPWLLLGTAILLFCGALLIVVGQLKYTIFYSLSARRNTNKNILSTIKIQQL